MFAKLWNLLWQNGYVLGQPFNVVHGQTLKNYKANYKVTLRLPQRLSQKVPIRLTFNLEKILLNL